MIGGSGRNRWLISTSCRVRPVRGSGIKRGITCQGGGTCTIDSCPEEDAFVDDKV